MKLFLLSGRMGVGKNETAKAISKYYESKGRFADEFSFAANVKRCARVFFGWDDIKDDRGRKLLQNIGGFGREYDQDLWVKQTHRSIQDELEFRKIDVLITTDWRYPSEYIYLKNTGVYDIIKIRVESENRENKESPNYNDTSETSLPSGKEMPEMYDYVIYNTGTKEDLQKVVYNLLKGLGE